MTTYLLDANVLIALTVAEHEHHERAVRWFDGVESFAVCPIVEGALTRFVLRLGERPQAAAMILTSVLEHPRAVHWPDDLSYTGVDLSRVRGHRQVTDTYLVALARHRGGVLATMDEGLCVAHPSSTFLLPPVQDAPG